jgi:hypothetical protein
MGGHIMRRRLILALAGLLVFLVGIAIGAGGGSGRKSPGGNTNAKTVATVTKTTRAPVPAACQQAISDARSIGLLAAAAIATESKWPSLVSRAAVAAYNQDVAGIKAVTRAARRLSANLASETPLVRSTAAKFNREAKSCR